MIASKLPSLAAVSLASSLKSAFSPRSDISPVKAVGCTFALMSLRVSKLLCERDICLSKSSDFVTSWVLAECKPAVKVPKFNDDVLSELFKDVEFMLLPTLSAMPYKLVCFVGEPSPPCNDKFSAKPLSVPKYTVSSGLVYIEISSPNDVTFTDNGVISSVSPANVSPVPTAVKVAVSPSSTCAVVDK